VTLSSLIESDPHERSCERSGLDPVVSALRRHFSETKEFGLNAGLRAEVARLRRMSTKAREHAEELKKAKAEKKEKKEKKEKSKKKVKA
jgi:septal ring factor EnvC (AmiA/AmiB activator)